jgi:hypothetical protein
MRSRADMDNDDDDDEDDDNVDKGYSIIYKKPENARASPVGQANSATSFKKCKLAESMVRHFVEMAHSLDAATATTPKKDDWHTKVEYSDCMKRCRESTQCWGFIYYHVKGTRMCMYKGGSDVEFTRSDRVNTYWN